MAPILGGVMCFCLIIFLCPVSHAAIRLPVVFQDHMVLQRDKEVAIWGWGDAGEPLMLNFRGEEYRTKTSKDGRWIIRIPSQPAGGPFDMILRSKADTLLIKDILFGDVWICGGQSNMQYSLAQIGYEEKDSFRACNKSLRLFSGAVDMDYVPREDLVGGAWTEASFESIRNFSATAYFFGTNLQYRINVPIGLVSINLGATAIETWMSPRALHPFPQFSSYLAEFIAPAKSFKEIRTAFEKGKAVWQQKYYFKDPGMEQQWYLPQTDISGWKTTEVPGWWEDEGLADFDGAVWFRKSFDLPEGFAGDYFSLALNQIDDYDLVWVNGEKVGEGYGNLNWRNYQVPTSLLKKKDNTLVVRVFDAGGRGGMYTSSIWGNPVLLGKWFYKQGTQINAKSFPKPHVVNASPFSTPSVLFQGSIAPLKNLAVKGVIWYQGESNAERAHEYRQLFPAMIRDWRSHFGQHDLPFLFVQLANYRSEPASPVESNWAELREAQAAALQLPGTAMAVAIDIGAAQDIHPRNKQDVGKRLALAALKTAYRIDTICSGPVYRAMETRRDSVRIHWTYAAGLHSKDKNGFLRGFAIAGADRKFHWAKAWVRDSSVVVYSEHVRIPVAVRYAWADNPGPLDLYNAAGLPAAPFRTDHWPPHTAGKLFSENLWD